ncbi:acylneuraminate cytidylyltransferase family protein [Patescibacteria group bacterium]|nr:acylneuraminate cytidylyltransferase family protein [Patescibacteria group bacterium]
MEILAIMPGRGGSKGVPRKNIKDMCGKPLLAWTIEEAKKSKYITRIILSTDDSEIASVGKEWGAEVPFMRPAELAEDSTPDLPVFEHALNWLKENENYVPDLVLHLRINSPLRTAEDIDRGIELMKENMDADAVRAVTKAPLHPLKSYRLEGDRLMPFVPEEVYGIKEPYNLPWQALPKAYTTGGYLTVLKPSTILEKHSMSGDTFLGFVVDEKNVVDIDTPEQFELARLRLAARLGE